MLLIVIKIFEFHCSKYCFRFKIRDFASVVKFVLMKNGFEGYFRCGHGYFNWVCY